MDLEAIRLFSIVAAEGSLQGAARAGNASRTTIRRKLDDLEAEVGVPLLIRGSQGVELTEAGEMLSRRASELVQQFGTLLDTAREIALNPPRPIRIVFPTNAPVDAHVATFRMLRQMWPDIQIEIRAEAEAGAHGCQGFDLCVTVLENVPEGPYDVYDVQIVDLILIASSEYLETSAPISSLEDLEEHPILWWEGPDRRPPYQLPCKKRQDLEIEPTFISNEIDTLHRMAKAGIGIAYVPHVYLTEEDRATFQTVLPDEVGTKLQIRMLVSHAVADSPRIHKVMNIIQMFVNPQK